MDKQATKVFCGGLSWETTSERLRAYFENFGVVREAFVSYNRNNGRPRGFGFVVFESVDVADKVVSTKHTIDRREVECKKAVPKEEGPAGSSGEAHSSAPSSTDGAGLPHHSSTQQQRATRKIFVGGLAPAVDDAALLQHFQQFGPVEDTVVMYDHDNKRPRGFGFVTFVSEDSVEQVFQRGALQTIADKQIEIKPAVPRDQMPPSCSPLLGGFGRGSMRHPMFDGRGGFGGSRGGMGSMGPMGMMGAYGGFGPAAGFKGGYGPRSMFGAGSGGGGRGRGGQGGFGGFGGMGGAGRGGGFGGMGKGGMMPPMGYDLYGPGGMFSNAQALYSLAGMQQQFNGMQPPSGPGGGAGGSSKLSSSPFQVNNLSNLKALALASSLGGFAPSQPGEGGYGQPDDPRPFAGASAAADFAAAEAAAANLNAATANGLSQVTQDFGAYDTGFSTAPAPGWSS